MSSQRRFRFWQFELRTLFVLLALAAMWFAWQYRREPPGKPPFRDMLKVGDQVYLQTRDSGYWVFVNSSRGPERTVKSIDEEFVILAGSNKTTLIRTSDIREVIRYEERKPPIAGANSLGNNMGSSGMVAPGSPFGGRGGSIPGLAPGMGANEFGGGDDRPSGR